MMSASILSLFSISLDMYVKCLYDALCIFEIVELQASDASDNE